MPETRLSLVAQLQADSEQAWIELDRIYRPLIRNWVARFQLDSNDTEDIVQDVLSFVFKKIRNFDHSGRTGAFRSWLRQTTVNVTRNFLRKRNRLKAGSAETQELLEQLQDPNSDLSNRFEQEHDVCVVQRLVEMVEAQYQSETMQIFRHHVLENHSVSETADRFQVNSTYIYKVKSRVLRRLRELASELIDDHWLC